MTLNLIVQEGIPEHPGLRSSADPMRLWWVDGKGKTKTLLQGPMKEIDLPDEPASPDHRYVAFGQWRGDPRNQDRRKVLHILDREGGKSVLCMLKAKSHDVIGWRSTESGPRAVAVTNRWQFDEQASELYLADPRTGELEHRKDEDARLEIDNRLSPDGKRRVRVGEDELIVTDTTDGRQSRFALHEDERPHVGLDCVDWASPRYLRFERADAGTHRRDDDEDILSGVGRPGEARLSHSCKFSPDFRWVLYQGHGSDGEGLFLAPVETPDGP